MSEPSKRPRAGQPPGGFRVTEQHFRFEGFSAPNYTPVPDDLFDELAPELTESELRVLLYVLRRTFGFKRKRPTPSQLTKWSRGSRPATVASLIVVPVLSRRGGHGGLRAPRGEGHHHGRKASRLPRATTNPMSTHSAFAGGRAVICPTVGNLCPPVGQNLPPQETGKQETENNTSNLRKDTVSFAKYDQARLAILPYAEDLGRELGDQAPFTFDDDPADQPSPQHRARPRHLHRPLIEPGRSPRSARRRSAPRRRGRKANRRQRTSWPCWRTCSASPCRRGRKATSRGCPRPL